MARGTNVQAILQLTRNNAGLIGLKRFSQISTTEHTFIAIGVAIGD